MSQPEENEICKHPENLKGKPGECTPEQIRDCHRTIVEEHPCPDE